MPQGQRQPPPVPKTLSARATRTATSSTMTRTGRSVQCPPPVSQYPPTSNCHAASCTCWFTAHASEATLTSRRVYVLEVIQQPQRARACGFGDKVSRMGYFPSTADLYRTGDLCHHPQLSNCASLTSWGTLSNHSALMPSIALPPLPPPPLCILADVISAIDVHRFILMVDLWNGDRTQQRSIVMHPGARPDQYALFTHAASRTASTHRYDMPHATFNRAPHRSMTGPASGHYGWQPYGKCWITTS
jgi:hypothetical protein